MYQNNRSVNETRARQKHQRKQRRIAAFASVALIGVLAVGGTLAYLFTNTSPVQNTFEPSEVTCAVVEPEFTSDQKTDVQIKNTGDTKAYIRAEIVVNWVDAAGYVSGVPVQDGDYTIELGGAWVEGSDGFYYWTMPVEPDGLTGNLIESCEQVAEAPTGYYLSVEILAGAIQSDPAQAFNDSWGALSGLTADNVTLETKTA